MVTADAFLLPVNVNDKRGGVRIGVNDHEGANGFALQLVSPIVVGRVYVVADLDVRIADCDPMVEVTFVTLLLLRKASTAMGICLRRRAMSSRLRAR